MASLKLIMSSEITALPLTASASDAAKFMTDMNVGTVVVMEGENPCGLLTDRDIVTKVLSQDKDPVTVKIDEIMTTPIIMISEEENIFYATKLMAVHGIRRLPVVNLKDELVGIVSLDDLLILLGDEMKNIASALKTELKK
jgi:CBS domain-containing protein